MQGHRLALHGGFGDFSSVVLNEAAVKYMGLENPIGHELTLGSNNKAYKVIGVIRDIVMGLPYELVKQTIYIIGDANFDSMILRINPAMKSNEAISKIGEICQHYMTRCHSLISSFMTLMLRKLLMRNGSGNWPQPFQY